MNARRKTNEKKNFGYHKTKSHLKQLRTAHVYTKDNQLVRDAFDGFLNI